MAKTEIMRDWMKVLGLLLVAVAVAAVLAGAVFEALRLAAFSLVGGGAAVMLPQAAMLFLARRQAAEAAFALWVAKFFATIILLAVVAIILKSLGALSAGFFIGGTAAGILFNIVVLFRQTSLGTE